MNILIVTQYFWPESFRINDLAIELKKQGHHITVLTGFPNYPEGSFYPGYDSFTKTTETYEGIVIKRVPIISRGQSKGLRLMLNYLSYVLTASLFGPWHCRGKVDMIFVFQLSPITVGIPAILLKKLKNAKLFFWVQDLWPESLVAVNAIKSPKILGWVDKLSAFIYRHCDKILIQCQGFSDSIIKKNIAAKKIQYFPNWAEALYQPINRDAVKIDKSLFKTGFNIVFAGNLGVAQSLETIIAAAEKLKSYTDIHWNILGNGRQAEWLKEQITTHALQNTMHLFGQQPVDTMPDYFAMADILLVTLKKDPAFALVIPSKIQSYLACGKPVVGALDGFGADVITDSQAGLVGPAEDADALANNILKCYQADQAQLAQMGANGLGYYQQYFNRDKLLNDLTRWMQAELEPGVVHE